MDGKIILWDILRGEALHVYEIGGYARIFRICCSNKHIWAHVMFSKAKVQKIIQINLKKKKSWQTTVLDKVQVT